MAGINLDFTVEDNDNVAIKKFKWSGHSPHGQKAIKITQKYLLPIVKSQYVKDVLYMGGGSSGKPIQLKISQKVDIWNHLNVSVKFQKYTMNFIVVLNDKIVPPQVDDLIAYFEKIFHAKEK